MSDVKYHEHREAQERAAAGTADDPAVRTIHRDLADRHARLAITMREAKRLRDILDEDAGS